MVNMKQVLFALSNVFLYPAAGNAAEQAIHHKGPPIVTVVQARAAVQSIAIKICRDGGNQFYSYGIGWSSRDNANFYQGAFKCMNDALSSNNDLHFNVLIWSNGTYSFDLVPQQYRTLP